jgi:hypothetical protein
MSLALRAYLLANEDDSRVLGCRRQALLDEVLAVIADRLADYDEQGDVEEKGQIGHAQALRELFDGRLTRPDCGPIYGWAYELYCSSMGEWLPGNPFSPCRYGWLFELDKFLAGHGVPLRLAQLVGDCPIPLPEPRELPCIGHWQFDAIRAARQPLAEALAVTTAPAAAAALGVVSRWLEKATGEPGSVIMGFFG